MKKPLILVTAGPAYDRQFHEESLIVNKTYIAAITAAGGLPVLWADWEDVEDYVSLCDGCVCTGTHQFTPDPAIGFGRRQSERAHKEHDLMRAFLRAGKPLLGICQGMQQLNVALGGTLDIDFRLRSGVEHNRTSHTVDTVEGTLVHRLFGTGFTVNSLHNVRVDALGEGLKVSATSPDGVIEAYEHETCPAYGFQWHPERQRGDLPFPTDGPDMEPVFHAFIDLCRT